MNRPTSDLSNADRLNPEAASRRATKRPRPASSHEEYRRAYQRRRAGAHDPETEALADYWVEMGD